MNGDRARQDSLWHASSPWTGKQNGNGLHYNDTHEQVTPAVVIGLWLEINNNFIQEYTGAILNCAFGIDNQ